MLLWMLRFALIALFALICINLLAGGLLVATLNAASLTADVEVIPVAMKQAISTVIVLFSMTVLAPVFEWWYKIWRNLDRWLQGKFRQE